MTIALRRIRSTSIGRIRGILRAGMRIQLERIEHRTYPGLEDRYGATGLIASGDFRGRKVNLAAISSRVGRKAQAPCGALRAILAILTS